MYEWLVRYKEKIGLMAIGHTFKRIEEFLFDWLLYGAVITWASGEYGVIHGSLLSFAILAPMSACLCWLYILFYDWAKKDWLGLELLKEWRDEVKHEHLIGRLFHRVMKWGSVPAFAVLSMHGDPFITTVYFRPKHRQYNGLTRRDWTIFGASVIFSNMYWTLRWVVLVELARILFAHIILPLAQFF